MAGNAELPGGGGRTPKCWPVEGPHRRESTGLPYQTDVTLKAPDKREQVARESNLSSLFVRTRLGAGSMTAPHPRLRGMGRQSWQAEGFSSRDLGGSHIEPEGGDV